MKKLQDDYLDRQNRIARSRLRAHLRGQQVNYSPADTASLATISHRALLPMHKACALSVEDIDEAMVVFRDISCHLVKGERVLLDFTKTTYISIVYAVYLYAAIQASVEKFGRSCIVISIDSLLSAQVKLVLRLTGILNLANGARFDVARKGILPIIYGTKDDQLDLIINYIVSVAAKTGNLSSEPKRLAEAEHLAWRAISEAMLNVDYHAYPEAGVAKSWWCTAVILEGDLYLSLCDRGVGIPKTLPRAGWWEIAMGLLPLNDDAQMIQAAMAYTRSAAKKKTERGLGTKDMQRLVLERGAGFMTIVSGRGHFKLDGDDFGKETIFTTKEPIIGTAINWKIPLRSGK